MNFDDLIRQTVKEEVARELAPFKSLLLHDAADGIEIEDLVDAEVIARLIGESVPDKSSNPQLEKQRQRAIQRVYHCVRYGMPCVRIGKTRMRFNLPAVKKWIAEGGTNKLTLVA